VTPLVSCLMVTAGRVNLARRAVQCFARQTWPAKELVIVDDGSDDYSSMLAEFPNPAIRYERIASDGARRLGALRNITLDLARGEYCIQWDDDEWYHPRRIEDQLKAIFDAGGAGACVLRDTLMHLDDPVFGAHLYRTGLRAGTPGSILHRRTDLRYANLPKGEDSLFRDALRQTIGVRVLDRRFSYLLIRCFHGRNTWGRQHFFERLHYTLSDKLDYAIARFVRRDLLTHPAFQLTADERRSAEAFLADSAALMLLTSSRAQAPA
jgi:glycosyltransferase involved in cell wall biosynthesis